jgi:predicted dehydrogenase
MCSKLIVGRFHPAAHRLKEIVDSGELGTLTKIEASLAVPSGFIKDDDIRMVYDLGGGALMDMGCEFDSTNFPRVSYDIFSGYTLSASRYLSGTDPTKVISAKAEIHPKFPQIDRGATATLAFPTPGGSTGSADGLTATLNVHLQLPPWLGFLPQWPKVFVRVTGTRGTAELSNFVGTWLYHNITVESSEQEGGRSRKRTEKRYGNLGWTT